jgi:hypothetical protein
MDFGHGEGGQGEQKACCTTEMGVVLCSAISIVISLSVYYDLYGEIQKRNVLGVSPWIDAYLYWSFVCGIAAIIAIIGLCYRKVKPSSRSKLAVIVLISLVVTDLAITLTSFILFKGQLIASYKHLLTESPYMRRKYVQFARVHACCGWKGLEDPIAKTCHSTTTCDQIFSRVFWGQQSGIKFIAPLGISLCLAVYALTRYAVNLGGQPYLYV